MTRGQPFIAVAGNIAAGKSTLVPRLAAALSVPAFQEMPERNPWFERAAADPPRWSYHAELQFLLDSVHAHRALVAGNRGGVLERPAAEHVDVFGRARRDRQWLDANEFELLDLVRRELCAGLVGAPDVLVVLHASPRELLARVHARHWQSERSIDEATLETLATLYDEFVRGWDASPVAEIDTEEHDVRSEAGLAHVVTTIGDILAT
jgi:deoxyadenosine/deoxycytidine kinase